MNMKLITRKSECIKAKNERLVKSPKEAIRKTLNNYFIKDGIIVKVYQPSYISKEEVVLRDRSFAADLTINLKNNSSFANIANP
jgi:hypothetical protein